jgi:hypothetical protein
LNLDQIALSASRNKVNKLGSVKHSDIAFMLTSSTEVNDKQAGEEDKSKLLRDLEARLLSFKLIREEFSRVVADIYAILQAGLQSASDANNAEAEESGEEEDAHMDDEKEDAENEEDDNIQQDVDAKETEPITKRKIAETTESKKAKNLDNWTDDHFDEYYGEAKKNRPGQRARRE